MSKNNILPDLILRKLNQRKNSRILQINQPNKIVLTEDGIELTCYLRDRLGHQKIVLIGSSLGSLIAMKMAKLRPDLFYAYVGTDQNAPDPQNVSYQLALNAFHAADLKKGVRLLERMGPDRSCWSRNDFDRLNPVLVKAIKSVPN